MTDPLAQIARETAEQWTNEHVEQLAPLIESALRRALATQAELHNTELTRIGQRLEAGTLHMLICNGDHRERVGKKDMICNCTLGREIQQLRHRAEAAEAQLATQAQEIATLKAQIKRLVPPSGCEPDAQLLYVTAIQDVLDLLPKGDPQ